MTDAAPRFRDCFDGLAAIGRDPAGGWTRLAWTAEDRAAREWFAAEAATRGLAVEVDSGGNQWAWWRPRDAAGPAVVTGSHADTVPRGGAFDGALGIVSALCAVSELRAAGVTPGRPVAVVSFADEEGARFNLPTFGSRVLAGTLDAATVLDRRDGDGARLADALVGAGVDPSAMGPDPERLAAVGAFVELHVEQGRGLAGTDAAVAVGTGIWPHGRWRLDLGGEANHAGTTGLADRRDPTLALAAAITAARGAAHEAGGVATVGRISVVPNATNSVPARVSAWLDARGPDDAALDTILGRWSASVDEVAAANGVSVELSVESRSGAVLFDRSLRERVTAGLDDAGVATVALPTAAGHDAGALAAAVPTAMLFVRNPTGVSHSPAEHADTADCVAGVAALRVVLQSLACSSAALA